MKLGIFLSILLCVATVHADENQNRIGIGAGFNFQNIDNHDLDHRSEKYHGYKDSFNSELSFSAFYERVFSKPMSGVLMYTFNTFNQSDEGGGSNKDVDLEIHAVYAAVKPKIEIWGVQSFLMLGLGGMYVDADQIGSPLGPAWLVGVGMDFPVTERIGFEILSTYTSGIGNNIGDYGYATLEAGITFGF